MPSAKKKIFLLANNWVGLEIAKYLVKRQENIVGLAIHEKDKQKFTKEIIKTVNLPKSKIFKANSLRDPKVVGKIKQMTPDIMIGAFWGYILKSELISIPPMGCINFHPGYLPFNRGMNPNVWPIVEDTPAGVTIHYVDEGIDTGKIIARKKVVVEPIDTGGSLYDKTLIEIVKLFKQIYPQLIAGKIRPKRQNEAQATFHWAKDIDALDKIELDKKYTARELIDLLRARTYADKSYAYFFDKGKKIRVGLTLSYDNSKGQN